MTDQEIITNERKATAELYLKQAAEIARLRAALEMALRYLENPEVQAIPFALPASAPVERIREVLRGQHS